VVNGFTTTVWKRLEALEKAVRFRHPRMIVLTVPTGDDGVRTPETETALAEIKRQHAIMDDDLVVEVANYTDDPAQLPQLVSITQQF
jgi:hypothetical protein